MKGVIIMEEIGTITLYSTGCPKCLVLKRKLEDRGLPYTEVTDVQTMLDLGITEVPVMRVGDRLMPFGEAAVWVNTF